ncbi:hypothetical protein [Fuerstiella marisgermanici]|uniref:Beta-xylosidase C-terminal Concanavalin A-like domain-containing protein n=1 Tax=Fuerstiella marisgermanici TaxID=1891926 RepID=A0A1P8WFU1_9PLAN|nr:hypothetical protein [Fuerstiella marisgermanici]APZ92921.1 hypothetical protein Fuma_02533 [Fuerstiella marisgermanici]
MEQSKGNFVIPAGTYEFGGTLEVDLTKFGALSLRTDGPVTIKMKAAGPAIRITGSLIGRAHPEQIKEHTWLERLPLIDGIEGKSIRDITATHRQVEPIVDSLKGSMRKEWRWLRDNRDGWKLTNRGLQVLIEPGNVWGKDNNAKNVLLHPIPDAWQESADVSVQLEQHPKKRWEQTNLVWYYSDSMGVKIGLELEHGKTNIVVGHESGDRTRTIAIVPYPDKTVQLRFVVEGLKLRGFYRKPGATDWTELGTTNLPADSATPPPKVSLQFYLGEANSNRWATVSNFKMLQTAR